MRTAALLIITLLALMSTGAAQVADDDSNDSAMSTCDVIATLLSATETQFAGQIGDSLDSDDEADWYGTDIWWPGAAECVFIHNTVIDIWSYEAYFFKDESWREAHEEYLDLVGTIRECLPDATATPVGGGENEEANISFIADNGSIVFVQLFQGMEDTDWEVGLSVSEF